MKNSKFKNFTFYLLHFALARQRAGFTLLEMVVALGIFAVAMVLAVGVVLSIFNARVKATTLQNVQDNIRYTFELMSRELRIGSQYSGTSCGANGCSQINFRWVDPLTAATEMRGYCRDTISGRGVIRRLYGGVVSCSLGTIMTADNVSVDRLLFLIDGATPNADSVERAKDGQPRLTILMQVTSQDPRPALSSAMNLETTVVQRILGF